MRTEIASVALAIVLIAPLVAAAQGSSPAASPSSDVQMQMQKKRAVVLPRPPQEAIEHDTEVAREKLAESAAMDELVRGVYRAPRRPDLDYSVTNGIAGRNADRLLRR